MGKTKRIIAAVTAAIITATSTSLMSVCADNGEVKKSTLQETAEEINEYMRSNGISGYTYVQVNGGTENKLLIVYDGFLDKIQAYVTEKGIDYSLVEYRQSHDDSIVSDKSDEEKTPEKKYAETILEYMHSNSIQGGVSHSTDDKLLTVSYRGNYGEQLKAYIEELGLDENNIKYELEELPEFIAFNVTTVSQPTTTTIAVTETKPVTTITMPVLDEPTIQTAVVTVTIMDLSGDNILVKPVDGSPELKSSSKFSLSAKQLPVDINPKVGMKLEITYNGGILETYPAQFANVQKVKVVSETANDKEAQKPLISVEDILDLSKKGDELTWSDFEKYEFTDIGDGTNIWQFVIKNSRSKLLVIGRDLKEKPEHINCVWGNGAEFDIRTEDLTPWFYDDSSSINGDANSNGNETCYSGGECEDGEMIVPETEDGKIVTEISLWSDDNIKALKIPATVNKVDIIKCLNLVKIEVSEDNPYLCSVDGVIYSKDMKKLVFYPSSKSGTEFTVPDTVEVIGEGAFNYAQKLKSVKLSDGVKIIKDSAFSGTKITDFKLPETLTDIEQYAFSENNSLTSITLPSSLKRIKSPFLECESLTEIVILHEIGDEHFESSGPRNPDDDYYRALLSNGSNITVFVPDNSYEDYNKYYKDRWKCKNVLPLSKYEKITIKGDTNCDGSVDMADAVLIMQALANPNKYGLDGTAEHHLTEQGKLNGDMNGDGLTVGDAQAIQKKLLGLDKADSQSIDSSLIANKLFRYEKSADPGIYDDLCDISFGSNGTYFYHIGYYKSSNQDQGTWTISGDTVVLTGQYGTNKFRYEDKALVYIAEESDGFSEFNDKSTPKDGEKFYLAEEPDYATINNLPEIVTIKSDYNPIMSDWSGIGILLEFDSKDYSISLRTDDGHFTTWDIAKGNGPIENAGKTYKIGNSGYIFWTPDEINFDADYRNEIVIIGEKDGKSVKLGNIVVTPSNNHTLTAVLK